MSEFQRVIKVMLASPGDMAPERKQVAETLEELNLIWASNLGVRLDLLRSETHSRPGGGVDAQEVINRQIGLAYQIFLGMMWKRFGTKTARAGSGTEEEFDRAYAVHKAGADMNIMFYFKMPSGSSNAAELAKIEAFRQKLESLGVLYWQFNEREDFPKLLRIHFSRELWERKTAGTLETLEEDIARFDYLSVSIPDITANFNQAESGTALLEHHLTTLTETMEPFGLAFQEKEECIQRAASRGPARRISQTLLLWASQRLPGLGWSTSLRLHRPLRLVAEPGGGSQISCQPDRRAGKGASRRCLGQSIKS